MRVLNVFQTYALFGKGNHAHRVQTVSRLLVQRGHALEILTVDYARRLRSSVENEDGVQIHYVAAGFRVRNISPSPRALPFLLRRVRDFDVVHIYGIYDLLGLYAAAACRARGVPYVVEPMGMFVPIVKSLRIKRAYHALFGSPLFAGAAKIIATSTQEQQELAANGLSGERVVVRLNGVDLEEFRDLPPKGAFRRELGIEPRTPLVLYVGRLNRKKSLEVLAEAVGRLPKDVHLAMIGPDEKDGTVEALERIRSSQALGSRLHVLPARFGREKLQAMVDADLFVLPSLNENWGNVVAESIACGVPAVVSDGCGIGPYVDGKAARVVPSKPAEMAEALSELLKDGPERAKLVAGCANMAVELSWEGRIAEMEALYRGLTRL